MAEADNVENLKSAIRDAESKEAWRHADMLYNELYKNVERDAETICRHALTVQNADDPARAATMLRRAIRMDAENTEAWLQLGNIYLGQKRHEEAEEAFRKILDVNADHVLAVRFLVQCLQHSDEGRAEAEKLLRRAIKLDPENAALWIQLASVCANDMDRFEEAEKAFKKGLELAPESPSAYHNYGQIKRARGELEEAKELLERAEELQQPEDTNYAFSLGLCNMFLEDMDAAHEWFKKSAEIDPDNNAAHVYVAFALFHQGKVREGWEQYEKRLDLREFKGLNYGRPRWDGEDLEDKTILLLREQGLGDNIQFIRFAKQVADRGGKVVAYAWDQLAPLYTSVKGVSIVTQGVPEPKHFYRYCPLLSLPYILKIDEDTEIDGSAYMKAPEDLVEKWSKRMQGDSAFRVGVVWRGNSKHVNDKFRSSSLSEMSQLFDVEGVRFFSLMKERPEDETELPDGLEELGVEFETFADTAAAMESLDLVITVDTSVCHLAGATGRPVWTMLAKGPDFRWGLTGETTPWYDSMTLYRQTKLGDWSDVYERMKTDLRQLASDA